jgi:hypothetical protein
MSRYDHLTGTRVPSLPRETVRAKKDNAEKWFRLTLHGHLAGFKCKAQDGKVRFYDSTITDMSKTFIQPEETELEHDDELPISDPPLSIKSGGIKRQKPV